MFAIFITANYFTASYTSLLSIPNFQASVNSFEDLANNKDVKTLLIKGSGTDEYIMVNSFLLTFILFTNNRNLRWFSMVTFL